MRRSAVEVSTGSGVEATSCLPTNGEECRMRVICSLVSLLEMINSGQNRTIKRLQNSHLRCSTKL